MLYLNILHANAGSSNYSASGSYTITFTNLDSSDKTTGYISANSGGNGYLSNGSGTIYSISGGGGTISNTHSEYGTIVCHVRIPMVIRKSLSDLGLTNDNLTDFVKFGGALTSISSSGGAGTVRFSNYFLTDGSGNLLTSGSGASSLPFKVGRLSSFMSTDGNYVLFPYFVEYDLMMSKTSYQNNSEPFSYVFTTTVNGSVSCSVASESDIASASNPVSDAGTQQAISDLNDTQEDIKETTEDTNETTHSIFTSISDFFGSFFENLIGIFVPDDDFFSDWFSDLNDLLSDKLGVLYYPFDFIISLLNEIYNGIPDNSAGSFTFPEVKINLGGTDYVLINRQTVSLNDYNIFYRNADPNSSLVGSGPFNNLRSTCRTFSNILIVLGLLSLFRRKLNLIIRGEDNDN